VGGFNFVEVCFIQVAQFGVERHFDFPNTFQAVDVGLELLEVFGECSVTGCGFEQVHAEFVEAILFGPELLDFPFENAYLLHGKLVTQLLVVWLALLVLVVLELFD
jgi:hypothetical protein